MGQQCCNPKHGYTPDQIPINIFQPEVVEVETNPQPEEVCQSFEEELEDDPNIPVGAMKLTDIPNEENILVKKIRDSQEPLQLQFDQQFHTYPPVQIVKYKPNGDIDSIVIYVGQWDQRQRNGAGIQYYPDGSIYEGHWSHNYPSGFGRVIYSDGEFYVGQWQQGKFHGEGQLVTKQFTYTGQWEQDLQVFICKDKNGQGMERRVDGTVYEGFYRAGMRHGQGQLKFADNSQYKGNFVNGTYDGIGEYRWSDGRIYGGEWKNNKMNGKGEYRQSNGDKYIGIYNCELGHFVNDKKHGLGKFIWTDGRSVEGEWVDGKLNGEARVSEINGETQIFRFKQGVVEPD